MDYGTLQRNRLTKMNTIGSPKNREFLSQEELKLGCDVTTCGASPDPPN